jgi:hypothetical protein
MKTMAVVAGLVVKSITGNSIRSRLLDDAQSWPIDVLFAPVEMNLSCSRMTMATGVQAMEEGHARLKQGGG